MEHTYRCLSTRTLPPSSRSISLSSPTSRPTSRRTSTQLTPVPKPTTQTPWWLAERIVVSAFEDEALEADVVALLDLIRTAITEKAVLGNIFDIAERLFDVVTAVLAAPQLKNLFTEANALVTVYFTTVFVVCCAFGGRDEDGDGVDDGEAMIASIREHEGVWVRLARLATKLLLNQQVYEFVADVREGKCKDVLAQVTALIQRGCGRRG